MFGFFEQVGGVLILGLFGDGGGEEAAGLLIFLVFHIQSAEGNLNGVVIGVIVQVNSEVMYHLSERAHLAGGLEQAEQSGEVVLVGPEGPEIEFEGALVIASLLCDHSQAGVGSCAVASESGGDPEGDFGLVEAVLLQGDGSESDVWFCGVGVDGGSLFVAVFCLGEVSCGAVAAAEVPEGLIRCGGVTFFEVVLFCQVHYVSYPLVVSMVNPRRLFFFVDSRLVLPLRFSKSCADSEELCFVRYSGC